MRNPYAKWPDALGVTQVTVDAIKASIVTWLKSHPEVQSIPDNTVRALRPELSDDRLWNQIKGEIEAGI